MLKAIDIQVQCTAKWGPLLDEQQTKDIGKYLGTKLRYDLTDDEMAQELRDANVKAMILLGTSNVLDIGRVRELHDRAHECQKKHPDVILGFWGTVNPHLGYAGVRELDRVIRDYKFVGYYHITLASGVPMNDPRMNHVYDLCSEAGVPVKLNIGHTAGGAGLPGGGGFHLNYEQPIPFFDDVCANFPKLTCISGHVPWPWHNELISVLLHKGNAYAENHGWAPMYVPEEIKKELNSRLQDKYMFASDYPFITHERVFKEWDSILKPEVRDKVYWKTAARLFKIKV
jgi:uncharacterized protein